MKTRRRLGVDTFPFLAVLLAAMGALILVLLVMDLRAKRAARNRVAAQNTKALEQRQAEIAARRADLAAQEEAQRQEYEQKRAALQREVESKQQTLAEEIQRADSQRAEALRNAAAERQTVTALHQQAALEQAKLAATKSALDQGASEATRASAAAKQAQAALEQMGQEQATLVQTVRDLKATRSQEPRTYSVVPYKGKQGTHRRPLYVECSLEGVTFHPDKVTQRLPLDADAVRGELKRRVEVQRPTLPEAQRALPPYLLLLVRPDGIDAYYALQAAVRGQSVLFGYEFIERDWLLDFPAEPPDVPEPTPVVRGPGGPGGSGGSGPGAASGRPGTPAPGTGNPLRVGNDLPNLPAGPSLPPVGAPQGNVTRLPERPADQPRKPARITPPREWLVYVECKADGATLHPTQRDVAAALVEKGHADNPLRALVAAMLQKQPEPQPGKAPVRMRVRFVVHLDGGRTFHAAYPALQGLPVDMDVVHLRRGDDPRGVLGQ